MEGIENPSEVVRAMIDYVKDAGPELISKLENLPDYRVEVPATSPYELALHVVAENCRRANQFKNFKDIIR